MTLQPPYTTGLFDALLAYRVVRMFQCIAVPLGVSSKVGVCMGYGMHLRYVTGSAFIDVVRSKVSVDRARILILRDLLYNLVIP